MHASWAKPIVAIKTGRSEVAKKMVVSHTASLAGSDVLVSALLKRLGVARVDSLEALMEALKVLHVLGPLSGGRIGAMSTSGGDLTLLADAMGPELTMPPLSEKTAQGLRGTIHELMVAANPFDFQMFDWNNEERMAENFSAFLAEDFDLALCLLDYPREDLCDQSTWGGAERGFVRSARQTNTKAAVLATFSDTISESVAERLMKEGVAMLAGIDAGIAGIQAAVDVGAAWRQPPSPPLLTGFGQHQMDCVRVLNEVESKNLLARYGVRVPPGRVARSSGEAVAAAESLGYPVVVKALGVTHKTDVGAVRLALGSAQEVSTAVEEMSHLCGTFLIEKMVGGVVAELIVGVAHDEQFGPYLLVGEWWHSGGDDERQCLTPDADHSCAGVACPGTIEVYTSFKWFQRGAPCRCECRRRCHHGGSGHGGEDPSSIIELDINPLMLLAEGLGVIAADALISLNMKSETR